MFFGIALLFVNGYLLLVSVFKYRKKTVYLFVRRSIDIPFLNTESLTNNLLDISASTSSFCLLSSNGYETKESSYDLIAGWGARYTINSYNELDIFFNKNNDWKFGYFSYDIKNHLEDLTSNNRDNLSANEVEFFVPEFVLTLKQYVCQLHYFEEQQNEVKAILDRLSGENKESTNSQFDVKIKPKETFEEYITAINNIKNDIKRGNVYEANYCTEFYGNNCSIEPVSLYKNLCNTSPTPFSGYFKRDSLHLLSASPERFLKRKSNKVISQPIKGTARRSNASNEDEEIKVQLKQSPKDISENIMIVDLVRNDLSKTSINDSVKVEELCEIYSFPQVHQMISTISSEVDTLTKNLDIILNAFPPGSMTGAPKVKAMELMEKYEKTKRGVYSGALGYFEPNGDFDLNVVIRTIIYNEKKKYLSFMVGGAITDNSIPENEYNECIIKAKAMLNALNIDESTIYKPYAG